MNKRTKTIALAALAVAALAACENGDQNRVGGKTVAAQQQAVSTSFDRLNQAQPTPVFDFSAIRQTLIDVETVQANGVATTTAFYLEGIGLVAWCPSKGLPVPSTYQLSNSQQYVDLPGDQSRALYQIDQGEPTGVYVGSSTGTYTICLDDNGKPFAYYWEGYTASASGVVDYPADKRISLTGDPSYVFKTKG